MQHADIAIGIAQAVAAKLTSAAYVDSSDLAFASRNGLGSRDFGGARASRVPPARVGSLLSLTAAYPPDFFRYLHDSDDEDGISDDDSYDSAGEWDGRRTLQREQQQQQQQQYHHNQQQQRARRRSMNGFGITESWTTLVRLQLTVGVEGCIRLALCDGCEMDDSKPIIAAPTTDADGIFAGDGSSDQRPAAGSVDGRAAAGPVTCMLTLETRRLKLCGTMGCTLPDRHAGLHVVPQLVEPRRRRGVDPLSPGSDVQPDTAKVRKPPQVKVDSRGGGGSRSFKPGRGRAATSTTGQSGRRPGHGHGSAAQRRNSVPNSSVSQKRARTAGGLDGKDSAFAVAAAAAAAAAKATAAARAAQATAKVAARVAAEAAAQVSAAKRHRKPASAGVFTVEQLLDRRWTGTRHQYLVRWAGFSAEEDTYAALPALSYCVASA